MSVIGGQNPIVQNGLVYILDFGNERSYVSGSISGSINGLRTVLSTGSATEFTLSGSVFNPADIYDMGTGLVITGYGWDMTDGGVVV
jgi:hypothetical protein